MMSKIFGADVNWRQLWLDYRSEAFFTVILGTLVVFSYWAAAFIPEDFFETFINPAQYVAMIVVCLCGAFLMYRHHEGIEMRRSWGTVLLICFAYDRKYVRMAAFYLPLTGLATGMAQLEKSAYCRPSNDYCRGDRLFCAGESDIYHHALSDSYLLSLMPSCPQVPPVV